MRLHRFYFPVKIGDKKEVTIDSVETVNQIRRVFRLKVGDEVIVFDGSGFDFTSRIESCEKESIGLSINEVVKSRYVPVRKIYLFAGIVKKDNFEFIVEKATELGVTDIVPVITERSLKKSLNEERLNKIAVEASEQSGRGVIPMIHPIVKLEECFTFLSTIAKVTSASNTQTDLQIIAFHTEGESFDKLNISKNNSIAIFIGPEGGWSPKEVSIFKEKGILFCCLGPQVLRAETAVVAVIAKCQF